MFVNNISQTLWIYNSRIPRIKNAEFSGYYFSVNTNIYGDFQICISVTSSLFYSYYFGRCSSELAQHVPLPFSCGRSTPNSDRLHDFSFAIPRCYKDVYVNSFFPRTAGLWNSLPIERFPLTYNVNGCKSRINGHLLTVGSL